jgi:uncharacterized protein (TIGR00369 family)
VSGTQLLERWNGCGYYRLNGMRVTRADADGSTLRITIGSDHLQAYGTAHGGVIAGLLDAAMGLAILGPAPDGEGCATIQMAVNFLAPARAGPLTATGRVVSGGSRIVVAWAEAADATGRTVACATGTFMRVPGE